MIAIIHNGQYVVGYNPSPDTEEMNNLGTQYDLLEEVPEIILNTPQGYVVRRVSEVEYELEELPKEPPDRIGQLENESTLITQELIRTQNQLEETESDQAALLLELVDKGVI